MRRWALSLLLATAGTAHAALPRVALQTPLLPASPASFAAAPAAILLPAAPAFAAAPTAPSAAPAAPGALIAPAGAMSAASVEPAGPRAIDALQANAPLADRLSASAPAGSAEDSARALEDNFNAAASLGSDGSASSPAGETARAAGPARDPLLARLLKTVRLDDGGMPERHAALLRAFTRMLGTPTARALAERLIADGVPAVVRFVPVEGSQLYEVNGRKVFYAPRAFTVWNGDHVEVRLNADYLGAYAEFQEQDLPATLAHELLGHGLWYSRAVRENALQAFHHHDLNETNARLVGWLVDFELDQRFEEEGAWTYLSDPAAFLNHLKLRLPYYALTWSTAELARPRETLEERSLAAQAKRDQLRLALANHLSWNGVIGHFASHHGVAEARLRALRAYMSETEKSYNDEIAIMDALIAEVDATVGRMNAEPDRSSERYLQWAATHPLFGDLRAETDASARRLKEQVRGTSAKLGDESLEAVKTKEEHWRGQITFQKLVEMYHEDRAKNPSHWQPLPPSLPSGK